MTRARRIRALQCTVLFVDACLLHGIGRELARGLASAAVGIPATVHHFYVVFDRPPESAVDAMAIALAPAAFSAMMAVISIWLYTRGRARALKLFALYLGGFGGMAVLAALMLIGSEGPLHDVAAFAQVPTPITLSLSITGGVLLVALMWTAGRQLTPPAGTIVVPFAATMALRALVYAPIPWSVAFVMIYSSSYWLIAMGSAYWHSRRAPIAPAAPGEMHLMMAAYALPFLLIALVRLLVTGVRFGGS